MAIQTVKIIGAAGVMVGIATAVVGLAAKRLGIVIGSEIWPFALLFAIGLVLLIASILVILKPKRWTAAIETGMIILITISIGTRSLIPLTQSEPRCSTRDFESISEMSAKSC